MGPSHRLLFPPPFFEREKKQADADASQTTRLSSANSVKLRVRYETVKHNVVQWHVCIVRFDSFCSAIFLSMTSPEVAPLAVLVHKQLTENPEKRRLTNKGISIFSKVRMNAPRLSFRGSDYAALLLLAGNLNNHSKKEKEKRKRQCHQCCQRGGGGAQP